jgi:cytochrome b561
MNTEIISKWPRRSQILHWLSALFIFGLFTLGVWMRTLDYYDPWYQQAPDFHKSFGVMLILIMSLRLVVRFFTTPPTHSPHHQPWEINLAKAVHWILYLGVILILITGYLIATSENRPIEVFEMFNVPVLIQAFDEQEDIAGFIHEWAAYILMAFVGLHIAGALKHHFIDKDNTLKRML